MPAFVRTKADEERWGRAKRAAGKQTSHGSEGFWKLTNYIYHKMGKSQEDMDKAEFYKAELKKQFGGMLQLNEQGSKVSSGKLRDFLEKRKGKK
jgi:hypothetical protein